MSAVVAYPSMIARACSTLDESPAFEDMPDGYIRIVARIIKKINLSKPESPIYASRSTIARESGKSLETVGRAIRWLEDRQLIRRCQKARTGLRGSSSPITPLRSLLDALLITSPQGKVSNHVSPETYAQTQVEIDASKSTLQEQPKGIQPKREFVRIGNASLPSDLAWMVGNDVKPSTILYLMKLASTAKKRLSDVVSVTKKYLENLRGRGLVAYILALLKKDRDYAWIAKQGAKEQADQTRQLRLQQKAIDLCGRSFSSRDGKIFVTVEKNGILSEIREGARFARAMDEAFLEAVSSGRLKPVSSHSWC